MKKNNNNNKINKCKKFLQTLSKCHKKKTRL